MLQCVAVCGSVLQWVVVGCSGLQCVAVCCSVLQCVAVCCSILQSVLVPSQFAVDNDKNTLSTLQHTATHCNSLQLTVLLIVTTHLILEKSHHSVTPPLPPACRRVFQPLETAAVGATVCRVAHAFWSSSCNCEIPHVCLSETSQYRGWGVLAGVVCGCACCQGLHGCGEGVLACVDWCVCAAVVATRCV